MSRYLPPQHGAWAFLVLPLALGATQAEPTWLLAPLALAWIAAYPLSYFILGMARSRRKQRFRQPILVWGTAFALAAAGMLLWQPWLLWLGLLYLALFAVNIAFARRNDERAMTNDLAFIAECALMVAVTWGVGAGGDGWSPPPLATVPQHVWILVAVCALVLTGSTVHVKSLIRERRVAGYRTADRGIAAASLAGSLVLGQLWGWWAGLWLVVPFGLLLIRAVVVGKEPRKPGTIGLIELGCFVAVVLGATFASI